MNTRIPYLVALSGKTLKKISEETGIAYPTLTSYNQGVRNPKKNNAVILAKYFEVSEDYLLGDDDNSGLVNETNVENDPALERNNQTLKQSSFWNTSEKMAHTGLQFLTDYLEEAHQLRLAYDYLLEENAQLKQTIASLKADLNRLNQKRSDDGA